MTAGQFEIRYSFTLPDGQVDCVALEIDSETIEMKNELPATLPDWTSLDFHKCTNCTLSDYDREATICPAAARLVPLIEPCNKLISYDEIDVDVLTSERRISATAKAEQVFSSLMGLIFATSGCPHMKFFKPMARYHLPFATLEETLYRTTGTYLLSQYMMQRSGEKADFSFEGLHQIYNEVKQVNTSMAARLRAAAETDSPLNALTLLDAHGQFLPFALEKFLDEFDL